MINLEKLAEALRAGGCDCDLIPYTTQIGFLVGERWHRWDGTSEQPALAFAVLRIFTDAELSFELRTAYLDEDDGMYRCSVKPRIDEWGYEIITGIGSCPTVAIMDTLLRAKEEGMMDLYECAGLLSQGGLQQFKDIWTAAEVESRNIGQLCGLPYVCVNNRTDAAHVAYANEHGGDYGQLVATTKGWHCPVCDYKHGYVVLSQGGGAK